MIYVEKLTRIDMGGFGIEVTEDPDGLDMLMIRRVDDWGDRGETPEICVTLDALPALKAAIDEIEQHLKQRIQQEKEAKQ